MAQYYIGQVFTNVYPVDAAMWCNDNDAYIEEIEPINNVKRFKIFKNTPHVPTQEEIDMLTMTALDFIGVLKQTGLTDLQIEQYLQSNIAIKHQLQYCKDVFCGVAKALMPITYEGITITADMVEHAFKVKNGVE